MGARHSLLPAGLAALCACSGLRHAPAVAPTPAPAAAPSPADPAVPATSLEDPASLEALLSRIEEAYSRGDYQKGLSLVKQVLEMKQTDNLGALERVGSTYYVLGLYGEAATAWQKALSLQKDPQKRKALEADIAKARRNLGLSATEPVVPSTAAASAAVSPLSAADRKDVEGLYQKAVEHYARGEFLQATALFNRILQIDPRNAQAQKALERLKSKR